MPPRQLAAKDEHHNQDDIGTPEKSSKRKAVSSACQPCRKRKSKCDGGLPACSTCIAVYRTECSYDPEPEHRRKPSSARRNVQSLPTRGAPSAGSASTIAPSSASSLDTIVNSLRHLPENEAIALLHQVRNHDTFDDLASPVGRRASASQGTAIQHFDPDLNSPSRPSTSNFGRDSLTSASFHSDTYSPHTSTDRPWGDSRPHTRSRPSFDNWFRTPQDAGIVDNLLSGYFAWHHPFHTVFSGPHFMYDFQKGYTNYCSSALLHAVLALACHYTDHTNSNIDSTQFTAMGELYFTEAQSLLNLTDSASLTNVQALAVMAQREASAGREKVAYRYLGMAVRMAMEMDLHLSVTSGDDHGLTQLDIETRKVTFWALYNMEM